MSPSARKRTRSAIVAALRVMRDHDHRLVVALDRLVQQLKDLVARLRVEVPGRLVGEDDGRLRDERARDGDPLLLAAGELGRPVRAPVRRARRDRAAPRTRPCRASSPAIESGRRMFSSAVSIGSRLKNWKMKPMCLRRSFVISVSLRFPSRVPAERHVAGGRQVERGEDVHQGRLAGARRAHDRGQLRGARRRA